MSSRRWWQRPSALLLVVAVVVTTVVALAANTALWQLHELAMADDSVPESAVPTSEEPLVVAVGRTSGGPQEWINLARVFAQVQKDTGRRIILRYVPEMNKHEALLSDGETDLALISVRAYLHASAKHPLALVATPIVRGYPEDAAVIVVRSDSDIEKLDDLRGRSVAVSPDLISGPFIGLLLDRRGIDPKEFFGRIDEHQRQDENLTHVAKGEADATAVRRSALASWPKGTFRVIETSPAFGMPPLVAREGLDDKTLQAVRTSLLKIRAPGTLPANSAIGGFKLVDDAEYDFAREVDRHESQRSKSASESGEAHQ